MRGSTNPNAEFNQKTGFNPAFSLTNVRIDEYLEVQHIIFQKRIVCRKSRVGDEERTAGGNVHWTRRFLKTGTSRIRSEGVGEVLALIALVDQHHRHLLAKRPVENIIVISLKV